MGMHSIRWRLPLSYAVIACVAALVLGAFLLAILRDYYGNKERVYLYRNATGISDLIGRMMAEDVPVETLAVQTESLAFFANARVRVLGPAGAVLADSGVPGQPQLITFSYPAAAGPDVQPRLEIISAPQESDITFWQARVDAVPEGARAAGIAVAPRLFDVPTLAPDTDFVMAAPFVVEGPAMRDQTVLYMRSAMPVTGTFYGFDLGGSDVDQDRAWRSSEQVQQVILGAGGNRLGTLVVSDGPAYGREIVQSVARGWAFAGGIAVLLAAGAGWIISRQITAPLGALTEVTARMAAGDLTTRADVTRRHELGTLAASFNEMAARIEETVTTLQRFVGDAAHELHTPLTALCTNLELAALDRAREQVARLIALTDDLLDLSRLETACTPDLVPVNLAALVRTASEYHASRAEQADVVFRLDVPDALPLVQGNAPQLQRLFDNLLDNAIKFTPPGGAVTVSLGADSQGVELVVADTGIGIPPDDLPLLFERFRRGRNAARYPGSGLGLALVRAIVRAHGGTVHAGSGADGTCFTVRLPVAA